MKSLRSGGRRAAYLLLNVGAAAKLPPRKDTLAERILDPLQVQRIITLEPKPRNQALLLLTYAAELRASEVCGLRWRDPATRGDTAEVVFGKGGKTRVVLLPASAWRTLEHLGQVALMRQPDAPVFWSQKGGGPLDRSAVDRIVRRVAVRARFGDQVSPRWLRHAHATHALEQGAPIHLVQATLGDASVATTRPYLNARPTDSSARFLGL